MAEPDSRAAITKVLRAHRARKVYHVTLARNLLDIVASGGLLSPQERGVQPTHSWGSNADAGTALVCLSFLPSWAMVKHQMQGKELVILAFDALLLENLESAIFCPVNSASHAAKEYLAGERDPIEALGECVDPEPNLNVAEMLIPNEVSLSALRQVVFSDETTMATWWPAARSMLDIDGRRVVAGVSTLSTFPRFPPDHVVTERTQVSPGTDQRRVPDINVEKLVIQFDLLEPDDDEQPPDSEIRWIGPEETIGEDLDSEGEWEDDGPPSWADFYDDGEPDDPDFYELSIRDP